jgi:hypothetical protein
MTGGAAVAARVNAGRGTGEGKGRLTHVRRCLSQTYECVVAHARIGLHSMTGGAQPTDVGVCSVGVQPHE